MRLNIEYNKAYLDTKNIILKCINNPEEIDTEEIMAPQSNLKQLPDKSKGVLDKFILLSKNNDIIDIGICKEYLSCISRLEVECILRYLQMSTIIKETLNDFSLGEDEDSEDIGRLNDIVKYIEIIFNTK